MNLQKLFLTRIIWCLQISMQLVRQILSEFLLPGLAEEARKLGTDAHYLPSFEEIEAFLKENCKSGDLLITMGAGDVVKIGEDILK